MLFSLYISPHSQAKPYHTHTQAISSISHTHTQNTDFCSDQYTHIMSNTYRTMNKFSQSIFLKKATLVSVSIFSLVFSYSFSSYATQIAHSIDKSYMFLLCNGILVLIVKNSAGLTENNSRQEIKYGGNHVQKDFDKEQEVSSSIEQKQQEVDEEESLDEEDDLSDDEQVNDHQDEEEDSLGLPSREELNKKCDDFIRKMKEEIKSGHQDLIIVN